MQWIKVKAVPPSDGPVTTVGYVGTAPRGETRAPDPARIEPQAFSVTMAPDCPTLRTHFHASDQFQLFTDGSARFANHDVGPGAVHYADRHTPYGPLRPGAEGVTFLTLRSASSAGAYFMPESREVLGESLAGDQGRPIDGRRNVSIDLGSPGPRDANTWEELRVGPDGLRIAAADLDPSTSLTVEPVAGDGAFLAVLDGDVLTDGQSFASGSLCWCDPGERGSIEAGPGGARLVFLQFPERRAA
jgi:hypothetical protein